MVRPDARRSQDASVTRKIPEVARIYNLRQPRGRGLRSHLRCERGYPWSTNLHRIGHRLHPRDTGFLPRQSLGHLSLEQRISIRGRSIRHCSSDEPYTNIGRRSFCDGAIRAADLRRCCCCLPCGTDHILRPVRILGLPPAAERQHTPRNFL